MHVEERGWRPAKAVLRVACRSMGKPFEPTIRSAGESKYAAIKRLER